MARDGSRSVELARLQVDGHAVRHAQCAPQRRVVGIAAPASAPAPHAPRLPALTPVVLRLPLRLRLRLRLPLPCAAAQGEVVLPPLLRPPLRRPLPLGQQLARLASGRGRGRDRVGARVRVRVRVR